MALVGHRFDPGLVHNPFPEARLDHWGFVWPVVVRLPDPSHALPLPVCGS